MNYEMKVSKHT